MTDTIGRLLHLIEETSLGEQTLALIPEQLTPDEYAFYAVMANGMRLPVEFVVDTDPIELSIERSRYQKQ